MSAFLLVIIGFLLILAFSYLHPFIRAKKLPDETDEDFVKSFFDTYNDTIYSEQNILKERKAIADEYLGGTFVFL